MPAAAEGGAARTRCVSQPDSAMPRAPAPEKMGRRQAPRDARARRPREFIIVSRPCLIVRCTVSSVRCVCSQVIHSHIRFTHHTAPHHGSMHPTNDIAARSLDRKRTGNGNGKAERHDPRRAATGADDKASLPGSPAQQPAQHARLDARRLASPREYQESTAREREPRRAPDRHMATRCKCQLELSRLTQTRRWRNIPHSAHRHTHRKLQAYRRRAAAQRAPTRDTTLYTRAHTASTRGRPLPPAPTSSAPAEELRRRAHLACTTLTRVVTLVHDPITIRVLRPQRGAEAVRW